MTAVEWLVNEINKKLDYVKIGEFEESKIILQQALEIEKQEIIQAAIWMPNHFGTEFLPELGKQYYNERYGKGKL